MRRADKVGIVHSVAACSFNICLAVTRSPSASLRSISSVALAGCDGIDNVNSASRLYFSERDVDASRNIGKEIQHKGR
jgi:hypothetical protein